MHQFKYLGKKKIVGKTAGKPVKAMTLPARMQPPDFSKGDGTAGSNSVGRDGQLADPESGKFSKVFFFFKFEIGEDIIFNILSTLRFFFSTTIQRFFMIFLKYLPYS